MKKFLILVLGIVSGILMTLASLIYLCFCTIVAYAMGADIDSIKEAWKESRNTINTFITEMKEWVHNVVSTKD